MSPPIGSCAPVRARLGLNPGQRGTNKLLASTETNSCALLAAMSSIGSGSDGGADRQGNRLGAQSPHRPGSTVVGLRVDWQELELRHPVKAADGKWNHVKRVRELRYDHVAEPGLGDRIVRGEGTYT